MSHSSVAALGLLALGLSTGLVGAQTVDVVHSFTRNDLVNGWAPIDLVQGEGNTLYGATRYGGASCESQPADSTCGIVFALGPEGTRPIHDLGYSNAFQHVRLSWLGTGELHVTQSPGLFPGRLFKLIPTVTGPWEPQVLHVFPTWWLEDNVWKRDGEQPEGPVLPGSDGRLYGTTRGGGNGGWGGNNPNGTVYSLLPDGSDYRVLHAFTGYDANHLGIVGTGQGPNPSLVQGADGHVYGTAWFGGESEGWSYGTVFRHRADTDAVERVHSFNLPQPASPRAGLVRGPDGRLFGTTGGTFGPAPDGLYYLGSVFAMTVGPEAGATATVTHLHSLTAAEGSPTPAELVLAPDGFLYGTAFGGQGNQGIVFRIRPDGTGHSVVHTFTGGADGGFPSSPLVVGADGSLYGVASEGGSGGGGVVYRIRLSPQASITQLIEEVEGLIDDGTLKRGQGKSLVGKLELALYMLEYGNTKKAITMLEAFIHEVRAFRNAGILEEPLADELIGAAQAAISSLAG